MPCFYTDINVLDNSSLLENISTELYLTPLEYKITGEKRNILYWLVAGI